jgi:hypothetical protein|tara:strand:- start:2398 stop:3843 length:1446 start_codon:yes stop_codon:yes gene_type:complete
MPGKKKASKKKAKKLAAVELLTPSEQQQLRKEKEFAELSREAAEEKTRLLHQKQQLLREQLRNQEDDTREFLAQFQRKVADAEKRNADLQRASDLTKKQNAESRGQMQAKYERKLQASAEKFARLEAGSSAEMHDLKQELAGLTDFREHRNEVTDQIASLQRELHKTRQGHVTQLAQLERKFIGEKALLKKAHDDQYLAIVEDARDEALKGFEADTRAIIAANRRMTKEMQFQRRQCEDLQKTTDEMAQVNKALRRDVELATQSAEIAAQASVRQKRKVKSLQARASDAESALKAREFAFQRAQTGSEAKRAREMDDARVTVEGLRKMVRAKDKELRTIKGLAKQIMNQRSETEQYFLQSLVQVKGELRDKRRVSNLNARASRSRAAGGGSLPALGKGGRARGDAATFRGTRRQYDEEFGDELPTEIVLDDLGLDDRERVLRLLLAKINHARLSGAEARGGHAEPAVEEPQADEGSFFLTT